MAFPLLRLPHLAFYEIYRYLQVSELILISQCSKRMNGIVRSMETSRKGTMIDFSIDPSHLKVSLLFPNQHNFTWQLFQRQPLDGTQLIERRIEGVDWKVRVSSEERWESHAREGFFEEDTLTLVRTILSLFPAQFRLQLMLGPEIDFDKLLVSSDTLHRPTTVFVDNCEVADDQMTFMLDHFDAEILVIYAFASSTFSYRKPLNYSQIKIRSAYWVTPWQMMGILGSSRRVWLANCQLISEQHLNQFLKSWVSGDSRTLEVVHFFRGRPVPRDINEPPRPLNAQVVLEGIPTIPGAKKRDGAAEYSQRIYRYERGVDVRREDGLLATVMFDDNGLFVFTVWYDPFPNDPKVDSSVLCQ